MTGSRIPMTQQGFDKIQKELESLESQRINIVQEVAQARDLGDISENAEYETAKQKQAVLENRICSLKNKLQNAQIIDISAITGNIVRFGASVQLETEKKTKVEYQLVGEEEADIDNNKISYNSCVGKSLIGKTIGDIVMITTPAKVHTFKITSVKFE